MAFGKTIEKLFFKSLHTEATIFNKPIVYLLHPEDLEESRDKLQYKFHWNHLLPSKAYGFEIRYIFFKNKDPKQISKNIISLLKTIKSQKNIVFSTYKKLIPFLDNNSGL